MKQDDNHNQNFTDKNNPSSEDEIEKTEDWLNEHGQPDFKYLQSLAKDGSPEALEKLRAIAADLDVEYDSGASTEELIDRIRSATAQNEDGGPDSIT